MNKAFSNFTWENEPSHNTPLSATNLNKINTAVNEIDNRVITLDTTVGGKYSKPSSGIPKSDLASAVQTSLGKADSAYQKASSGIPKTDLASAVQTSLGKADTAYQKPSNGIPSTDMSAEVQEKLGYFSVVNGALNITYEED